MIFSMMFLVADVYAQFPGEGGGERKELEDVVEQVLKEKMEEKEEEMLERGDPLDVKFGFYYPSLAGVNNRIRELGIKVSGSTAAPKLEGGFFPGIVWRYSLTPELQVGYYGAMANYWCRGDSGTLPVETGLDFAFHSGLAVFKPSIAHQRQFRPYAGIAIGTVTATYTEDAGSGGNSNKWSGGGIGCLPFLGLQWQPNPMLGFSADYGYMIATIPSAAMNPRAGTSSSTKCPDIELSGSLIKLSIQCHF